jgi:hypothetical protein
MGGALVVGLTHEDAARYAFLLATPIIGAAALLKLPDLFGPTASASRSRPRRRVVRGSGAWASVRFLMRYFETNSLHAVRVVLPARRLSRTARVRRLRSSPQHCPHVGRKAVEMLKKKFPQIAATSFFDHLDPLPQTLVSCLRRARSASRSKPSPKAVPGRERSAETVDESETGSANFFGPALARDFVFWSLVTLHESLVRVWKKKSAQFAHTASFGPLDRRPSRVSVLLAPSTERE